MPACKHNHFSDNKKEIDSVDVLEKFSPTSISVDTKSW